MPRSTARIPAALLLVAVVLGVLAACGGPDLTKSVSQRSTVPPQPGSGGTGPVPEGAIDEPALAPAKLRAVDTCALLKGETVTQLGSPKEPSGYAPERCSVRIVDAGGEEIRVSLNLGASVYGGKDKATGGLDGLPLIESRQDTTCFDQVLTTDQESSPGIEVTVSYDKGEPCGAGRKVLAKVIQQLRNNPPQVDVPGDSLRLLDPCEVMPEDVVKKAYSATRISSTGRLFSCSTMASGEDGSGSVSVRFSFNYPPSGASNEKEVTLSSSVTAVRSYRDKTREACEVSWEHKEFSSQSSQDGEAITVDVARYGGEGTAAQACKKAVQIAKALLGNVTSS